ncbi:sulfotransferase domain-containing protein [Aliiruegeria haliotis]|uniref:Sulfotransferase domain-containing protein n=1 Tax=Aliiruegeria haliotis TaxID=1280846 RepID=A0A2T0RGE5_9RHOB|nr:sulfotransferase domain-containing protein [Aliiruegeria haliotis]PRY20243.1 sulfotransferase domain-containing protein [Aliiruegeria haliotis]
MAYEEVFDALPSEDASFEPCFAFSIHKCGSTMMHSMIGEVCKEASIPAISVPDILFNAGYLGGAWQSDEELLPAFQRRILYYGFRNLPRLLSSPEVGLKKCRFVLLVRDPRDALVSQYFSWGSKKGSHRVPEKNAQKFIQNMARNENLELDEYVLQSAGQLKAKFEGYRTGLDFDQGLLRRYEDVYFDKKTFLGEVFDHLGLDVDQEIINRVAEKADIRPEKEDPTKHIRKGTPGDHREKLQPETIGKLNDLFRETGAFFGYDL